MKIDLEAIDNLLKESNLSEVAKAVGIPYRTLQAWKRGENKWWSDTQDKLTRLQNHINMEENKMIKQNELEANWGIKVEDNVADFDWLVTDPLDENGKMTRELGIEEQGGKLVRLRRANDKRGNFVGLFVIDGSNLQKRWNGKVSVNSSEIRWHKAK